MARSQIILDLINNSVPLSDTLMRLSVLFDSLGNKKLKSWINCEICGYDDKEEIPKYRCIQGTLRADIIQGFRIWHDQDIPFQPESENYEQITTKRCYESFSSLEQVANGTEMTFYCPLPPDAYPYVNKGIQGNLQSLKLVLTKHSFNDVCIRIKKIVLDVLLYLEKEFDNLDAYDLSAQKAEEKEQHIINLIYNNYSISIGDNNKIIRSDISTGEEQE